MRAPSGQPGRMVAAMFPRIAPENRVPRLYAPIARSGRSIAKETSTACEHTTTASSRGGEQRTEALPLDGWRPPAIQLEPTPDESRNDQEKARRDLDDQRTSQIPTYRCEDHRRRIGSRWIDLISPGSGAVQSRISSAGYRLRIRCRVPNTRAAGLSVVDQN